MDWVKKAARRARGLVREASSDGQHSQKPMPAKSDDSNAAAASTLSEPVRVGPFTVRVRSLGQQQSNFPHVFRDNGGGGTVDGQHLIIFADSTYTRGASPAVDPRGVVGFVSNSLAVLGDCMSATTAITRVVDTGTAAHGPALAVPFLTEQGESPTGTAVWPNQNIAPVGRDASRGIAFPEVIDRELYRAQKPPLLYNTAIEIRLADGLPGRGPGGPGVGGAEKRHSAGVPQPVVRRAVKSLFVAGEPMFGSFAVYYDGDGRAFPGEQRREDDEGWLYLVARVSEAHSPRSNGLKLARVRPHAWADRAQYTFWDGERFGAAVPAMDDGGAANVLHWDTDVFGRHYGPASGDVWWVPAAAAHGAGGGGGGAFVALFQSEAAAVDNGVYVAWSTQGLTRGWSAPTRVWAMPRAPDGFSYGLHAYPNMATAADGGGGSGSGSGHVVPITWTRDSKTDSCSIQTGEVHFG